MPSPGRSFVPEMTIHPPPTLLPQDALDWGEENSTDTGLPLWSDEQNGFNQTHGEKKQNLQFKYMTAAGSKAAADKNMLFHCCVCSV